MQSNANICQVHLFNFTIGQQRRGNPMLLCLARATNRNLYDFWHIDCSTSFKLESKCKRQMLTGKPMEESANSWIFPAFCIVCPSQRIFNKDGSNSLPETNSSPLKMSHPKRKRSSSYHFQVLLLLVSGRVGVGNHEESCDVWKCHQPGGLKKNWSWHNGVKSHGALILLIQYG